MVYCYQNCSDLLWEKVSDWLRKTFEIQAENREVAKFLRSVEQLIQTERSEQFLVPECFFNLFLKVSDI